MVKVSVVVPVYGTEKFIERCARSLFEQTLDDIEYIFVDDCSPDNSVTLLRDILKEYPMRKRHTFILRHNTNKGLPLARKTGLDKATGNYIIHCDSDDWVEKNAYEKLYQAALATDSDIVFCGYYAVGDKQKVPIQSNLTKTDSDYFLRALLAGKFMGSLCLALCRRELYNYIQEYPTANMIEDLALMVQLVHASKKCTMIPDSLYNYFYRESSISYAKGYEQSCNKVKQASTNMDLIIRFLESAREGACLYANEILALKVSARFFMEDVMSDKRAMAAWENIYPEIEDHNILFSKIPLLHKLHYYSVKFRILPQIRTIKRKIYNPIVKKLGKSTSHSDTLN